MQGLVFRDIMTGLIFLVGFLMVGGLFYLAWRQHKNTQDLPSRVAAELGLSIGTSVGNRIFEFPAAFGSVQGRPVWIGSARRRLRGKDTFFLQVVVGRHGQARVGPRPVGDRAVKTVPFAQLWQALAQRPEAALAREARCGALDGGEIDVYPDAFVRTFTVNGIGTERWSTRVKASVRMLVAYAEVAPAA